MATEAVLSLEPWSWSALQAYAASDQQGTPPRRHPDGDAGYALYKEWITSNGIDNHGYIVRYVCWSEDGHALEPNLVPYNLEAGITHWVLWHHPERTGPSGRDLEMQAEFALIQALCADAPRPEEVIVYQNTPGNRSIPTIAHSQVFFRPADDAPGRRLAALLDAQRDAWRERSPFLNRGTRDRDSVRVGTP